MKKIRAYFKSTFVRYFVSYLVLMALLVGGLTVYMYSYYRKSVYDSTISAETSYAWQLKYRVDAYMDRLESIALMVNGSGGKSALSSSISDFEGEGEDGQIYVYLRSDGRVYASERTYSADAWIGAMGYDEDITRETIESELLSARKISVLRAAREGETAISVSVPTNGGCVIGVIPESALLGVHSGEGSDAATESNRYIIFDNVICARSEAFSIAEERVREAGNVVNSPVSARKMLQGVEYLFIALPGEQDGMIYVSVQPLTGIRAKAAGVWLGFMAVLLTFAIPCTLFMVFISRKNLAPILEMGKHFGRNGDKYSDDISTIVSGIQELEGLNREIQSSSLGARRHVFARNLVSGAYEDEASAREAASELGLDIDKGKYAIILIGAPKERTQDAYIDSLIALAPESVCCAGTDLVESGQIMLICFAAEPGDIETYAKRLGEDKLITTLRAPVAISDVHDNFKHMSLAYLEATSAYESRFFMGDNRLLRFSEIPFSAGKTAYAAEDLARDIKSALVEGDMALVDKSLERLRNTLNSQDMNLFSFRRVYNDVIGAIMSQAEDQHYSNADIYDLFSLSGCRSVEELEQVLRSVCESIISSKNTEDKLPLIRRIMRIMTVNYTDSEFTLAQAAELAGISPVRLSSEFKTKMGMTPMDYLTMLRMEQAKKLLGQSDAAISDVCRQAGYSDASSFARRFKQYAGVTPLQYRQAVKNGATDGEANDADTKA